MGSEKAADNTDDDKNGHLLPTIFDAVKAG